MHFSWRSLLAATGALVLALACVNCGGGLGTTSLSTGGSSSGAGGGSGSGSGGSGAGGSSGSGGNGGSGSSGSGGSSQSACSAMSTGQGASLNGFLPFGSDNLWN